MTRTKEIRVPANQIPVSRRADASIAVVGNPNAGKSTLFNRLTGLRQRIGNYPGVTVERHSGRMRLKSGEVTVVDLPGTYSLTAYSMEELVARDYLVNEKPALVINIVDASNLERNLLLCLQFMEMGLPVVLALNMMDVARKRGIQIDAQELSKRLGCPVVPVVASRSEGVGSLKDAVMAAEPPNVTPPAFETPADRYRYIDDLLENILLVTEVAELKANPNRAARTSAKVGW